jgi:cytochrome c oxidase subunit 3
MSDIEFSQGRPASTAPIATQPLEHHALSPADEHEANLLGMWLFLAGEVMFFGALFTAYLVYRMLYPEVFAAASHELDFLLGAVNTALLLTSSLTMALAVQAALLGRRSRLALLLALTILLAAAFIGIKVFDYAHLIREGFFPGSYGKTVAQSAHPQPVRLFFSLYFTMTGLHAVHMLLGILVMAVFAVQAGLRRLPPPRAIPVEMLGLYWHFVDIVWIFLYPLFYLIDLAG